MYVNFNKKPRTFDAVTLKRCFNKNVKYGDK